MSNVQHIAELLDYLLKVSMVGTFSRSEPIIDPPPGRSVNKFL